MLKKQTWHSIRWKQKISILTMVMFLHIIMVQSCNVCSNIMSQCQRTALTHKKRPHPCHSFGFALTLVVS